MEEMGMSDRQFKAFLKTLLDAVENCETVEEVKEKLRELIEGM